MRTNLQRKCRWLPCWLLACMMALGVTNAWGQGQWTYDSANQVLKLGLYQIPAELQGMEITIKFKPYLGVFQGSTMTLPEVVYADGKMCQIIKIDNQAFASNTFLQEVSLPSTIREIGQAAFSGCTNLKAVKLPERLAVIQQHVFDGCAALETITLPESIGMIGDGAFAGCTALKSITLIDQLYDIRPEAFKESGLTSIEIPAGVEILGESAFSNCTSLTSVTLNEGLETIEKQAFTGTPITSIEIPKSVTSIEQEAFQGCGSLATVTFKGDGLTTIGSNAFDGTVLTGIELPSMLKTIGDYAFQNIKQLTSIEIPASVEDLGWTTFSQSGLTSVTFIEGSELKEIGQEVFYECPLESVTIPKSVTEIKGYAFKGCSTLTKITYLGTNEPTIGTQAFFLNGDEAIVSGRKIYLPNGDPSGTWNPEKWGVASMSDLIFSEAKGWEYDSSKKTLSMDKTVINNVTADGKKLTIGDNVGLDLSELSLPDSAKDVNPAVTDAYAITGIAAGAFKQNAKLTKITLPATVTSVGSDAFAETITELHLLHADSTTLTMNASGLNKNTCEVYVPKGKLTNFHSDDPYKNWNGFAYILEEGGDMVAINYVDKDGNPWTPDESLLSEGSFLAKKAPVGQTFVYTLSFASKDSTLKFQPKALAPDAQITIAGDTLITLKTPKKGDCTLTVTVLGPIEETASQEIVINSDSEYKKDGSDTPESYNGTIASATTPKLTIGVEGETQEINITMKEVTVAKADKTAGETIIPTETTATLTLEGTNNLGDLTNNGTLNLTAADRTKIKLPGIKITNNKVFRDSTGIITEVEGTALLKVNAIPSQPVETGGTVTLKAKVTSNAGMKMDYKWLRLGNDGKWIDYPSAPAPAANFSMRAATTTEEYENELTVKAEDKGEFRCEITAATTDESSITMLTVFATVTLNDPAPDPVTYSVILPEVEGASTDPQANTYWRSEGDSFSFTLTLDADYDQSKPVVKAGDKVIEPNADGKYVIESIYEDITISITGIEKNTTVGNAEVEAGEAKVWSDNRVLHIYTPIPARVRVVNFIGSPVKDLGTVNGDTQTTLPKGSYIIVIGDSTKKIAL